MIPTEVHAALERVVQQYLAAFHRYSVRLAQGHSSVVAPPALGSARRNRRRIWWAIPAGSGAAGLGTRLYELAGAAGVWAGSADDTL